MTWSNTLLGAAWLAPALAGVLLGVGGCQSNAGPWTADAKLEAAETANTGYNHFESKAADYTLPALLTDARGQQVASAAGWEKGRRAEILRVFEEQVFGRAPGKPDRLEIAVVEIDPQAMLGSATYKRVRLTPWVKGKSYTFEASVYIPNKRGIVGAFLLINNRGVNAADPSRKEKSGFWPAEEIVRRGFAAAVVRTVDIDPDEDGEAARQQGIRRAIDTQGDEKSDGWGTIAAWAWGASRVMDYLLTEPMIDPQRIAVVGHSRGGKTALWTGATDERFSLVVSNCSGCTGAAISRRMVGETVRRINEHFPYWFCGNYKRYNDRESDLPVDQHQLLALMAPRALYVASKTEDLWADPKGEFLGLVAASPAWGLYGQGGMTAADMPPADVPVTRGKVAYHIRTGEHDLTAWDWGRYMDFAERQWGLVR